MQHLQAYRKWIVFFAVLLVVLGVATPVLADYIGPKNRTVTTGGGNGQIVLHKCQYVAKKQRYGYKNAGTWSCGSESKEWLNYPSESKSCNAANKGYEYYSKNCDDGSSTTYPPATILGSIENCTLQNGWCITTPQLDLIADEPIDEDNDIYYISQIEGTYNGTPDLPVPCEPNSTTCSEPLSEGDNDFTYWAHSTWGDTSYSGSSSVKVDTVPPSVSLQVSGTSGLNGWYVSPTTLTAIGSDETSGVASQLLSIEPDANPPDWQPSKILGEGIYDNIEVQVTDNAGLVSTAPATLKVDTTTPTINLSVNGMLGNNSWYISAAQVSGTPDDATSKVATFEVAADGAGYQAYTAPVGVGDGLHTLQFKAVDYAGNQTETPVQTFLVDTQAPTVRLQGSWQLGENVPYEVVDTTSGLAAVRIVIEDEDEKYPKVAWNQDVSGTSASHHINWDGKWKDKTVAVPGTYLVWIKASDRAGNERIKMGRVIVPEPNVFHTLNLLPTEAPVATMPPAPPADLSDTEVTLPVTAPTANGAAQPGAVTAYTPPLTIGTGGAVPNPPSSLLWGGTSNASTNSMPWLPIAAAATLGTSAVVATALKRKEQEEEPGQRFPENPIPSSLFPIGNTKDIPSYRLDGGGSTGGKEHPRGGGTVGGGEHPRDGGSGGGTTGGAEHLRGDTVGGGVVGGMEHPRGGGTAGGAEHPGVNDIVGTGQANISNRPKDPPPPPPGEEKTNPLKDRDFYQTITGVTSTLGDLTNPTLQESAAAAAIRADASETPVLAANYRVTRAQNDLNQAEANLAGAAEDLHNAQVQRARADAFANSDIPAVQAAAPEIIDQTDASLHAAEGEFTGRTAVVDAAQQELDAAQEGLHEARSRRAIAYLEATNTADDLARFESLPENVQHLSGALDNIDNVLDHGSLVMGGFSITGAVMQWAGIKGGQTVSDIGTVGSTLFDIGSLASGMTRLLSGARAVPLPAISGLARVGGVFAAVVGGYTMITEGGKALDDWKDGDLSKEGQVAGVNAIGGALTMAGGIAMLIPGGQLIGGILLAAGGVASGIAWYMENKDRVDAWVKNTASNAWNLATSAASNLWNTLTHPPIDPAPGNGLGSSLLAGVLQAPSNVAKAVSQAATNVKNKVTEVANNVKNKVTEVANNVKNKAAQVANTVKNTVSKAVNAVKNTVNNAVNTVKNTVSNTVNTIKNTVSNTVNTVKNTVSNAVNTAKNTVTQAANTVKTAAQTVSKAVSNATQTVSKTVNTVTQKATNTVKSIGNTISNWFKH